MIIQRTIILLVLFILAGCVKEEKVKPLPIELTREHTCAVCGMIIVDFPGAKAQIHYKNGKVDTFCSTLDMLTFYLQPDRPGGIVAIYVNDMGKADWKHPKDYWIDAEKAIYIHGADVKTPMGESPIPFSDMKDVIEFLRKHGGRIVGFDDVDMKMLRPGS
jgi:copper chaperone NosL